MRNQYPESCVVCRTEVLPGRGEVTWLSDRVVFYHLGSCPRTSETEERARQRAVYVGHVLESKDASRKDLVDAVSKLAVMVKSGWLDVRKCELKILECAATQDLDRLDVEMLLTDCLLSHAARR
jgi:hypothetical protein